jgi:hypothetical protein
VRLEVEHEWWGQVSVWSKTAPPPLPPLPPSSQPPPPPSPPPVVLVGTVAAGAGTETVGRREGAWSSIDASREKGTGGTAVTTNVWVVRNDTVRFQQRDKERQRERKEREKERETERDWTRERDREDRERDGGRDRERDWVRYTERDRERDKERDRERYREGDKHRDGARGIARARDDDGDDAVEVTNDLSATAAQAWALEEVARRGDVIDLSDEVNEEEKEEGGDPVEVDEEKQEEGGDPVAGGHCLVDMNIDLELLLDRA